MKLKGEEKGSSPAGSSAKLNGKRKKKSKSKSQGNSNSCSSKPCINGVQANCVEDKEEDSGVELPYAVESLTLNDDSVSKKDVQSLCRKNGVLTSKSLSDSHSNSTMNGASTSAEDVKVSDCSSDSNTVVSGCSTCIHLESAPSECETVVGKSADNFATNSCAESSTVNGNLFGKKEEISQVTSSSENACQTNDSVRATLKSPELDCKSEGSNDSGKGCSEFQFGGRLQSPEIPCVNYEFEIPRELCGLLIGRNGRFVKYIKDETNANIVIKRHPFYLNLKLCSVTGTHEEVNSALECIRNRFPLDMYPAVSLIQVNGMVPQVIVPPSLQLTIPDMVPVEVSVCHVISPLRFFLQQPTHPTFYSLSTLTCRMTSWYSESDAPPFEHIAPGNVCAAKSGDKWYRTVVNGPGSDPETCEVRFLDYGGYASLPISSLRQISYDFMEIPFQAVECYLAEITYPEGENEWSAEAKSEFEELAQGQVLHAYVMNYALDGKPILQLYKPQGQRHILINRELVNRNLASFITIEQQKTILDA